MFDYHILLLIVLFSYFVHGSRHECLFSYAIVRMMDNLCWLFISMIGDKYVAGCIFCSTCFHSVILVCNTITWKPHSVPLCFSFYSWNFAE